MKKIKTLLCDVLNISVPIIQAPIGVAVTPQFASTVSNYGALGMLPLGTTPVGNCENIINETLNLTNQPIGVNLILEWDQSERLEICLKQGIKIIWFFWGDPSPFVKKIHAHGAKVILTVGSADEAKQAVDAGVDVIVAQGWEAGGHIWGNVATMPLVPAVIDAIQGEVPVVTAGGIADGRGLAANLALGAEGIVMGTRLLSSHEANIHEEYKNRIVSAKETDTVYTDIFDKEWPNVPARVLRNSTYDQWLKAGKPGSGNRPGERDTITHYSQRPVERYSIYMPTPIMEGDLEPMAHYAGQTTGLVRNKKFLHEIFDEVLEDAAKRIRACQTLVS